jgi:hypothetical protein
LLPAPIAAVCWAAWPRTPSSLNSDKTARRGGGLKFCGDLHAGRGTLVIVFEVEYDFIEVLQGEGIEDFLLPLRIIRDVSTLHSPYVTSFFIDSIRSFFSSLEVFIQNYSYNITMELVHCTSFHKEKLDWKDTLSVSKLFLGVVQALQVLAAVYSHRVESCHLSLVETLNCRIARNLRVDHAAVFVESSQDHWFLVWIWAFFGVGEGVDLNNIVHLLEWALLVF